MTMVMQWSGHRIELVDRRLMFSDISNLRRDNFNIFWTQSLYRVAVDGGLNILNELDKGSPSLYIPHTVIGDLDSADSDLLTEYDRYGVEIIKEENQENDYISLIFILIYSICHIGLQWVSNLWASNLWAFF